MATINDFGNTETLGAVPLGGPNGWAAAVAADLNARPHIVHGVANVPAGGTTINHPGFSAPPTVVATAIRELANTTDQIVTVRPGNTVDSSVIDVRTSTGAQGTSYVYWIAIGPKAGAVTLEPPPA